MSHTVRLPNPLTFDSVVLVLPYPVWGRLDPPEPARELCCCVLGLVLVGFGRSLKGLSLSKYEEWLQI